MPGLFGIAVEAGQADPISQIAITLKWTMPPQNAANTI